MAKAELKKKSVAAPVKLTTAEEKKKALASAIAHIEKMYGAGAEYTPRRRRRISAASC